MVGVVFCWGGTCQSASRRRRGWVRSGTLVRAGSVGELAGALFAGGHQLDVCVAGWKGVVGTRVTYRVGLLVGF